jgi:cobalamin biosynthesis Mg chelatase CobN
VSPRYSRLVALVVAACASLAVFVTPAPAATPCWKLLLNDWYDGTISNIYPIPCYHQAIAHLPTDIKVYSSAADDINRALQAAIARQKKTHKTVTAIETGATTQSTKTTSSTTTTPTTTSKKKPKGPLGTALRDITPGGADSFPLPLLILGLLAILLVLAGVGGMLWRRYQDRGGAA